MNYTCEICGDTYEPVLKHFSDGMWDIPYHNGVRIDIVSVGSIAIHSYKTCPLCASKVLGYINRMRREAKEKGK